MKLLCILFLKVNWIKEPDRIPKPQYLFLLFYVSIISWALHKKKCIYGFLLFNYHAECLDYKSTPPPLPSTTVRYFLNGKESSYIISLVIVKIHLFTMFLIPALISTDIFLTPLKSKVMFLCFTVDYYGLYLVLISPSPSRTKHLLTNLVNSVDFKEKKCVHFFRILRKVLQVMREGSEQQKLW